MGIYSYLSKAREARAYLIEMNVKIFDYLPLVR